MIILLTGTPGTGKSTVAKILSRVTNSKLMHINNFATEEVSLGIDEETGSKVIDIKKLSDKILKLGEDNLIIEGHLSHLLSFGDLVIVLRTNPTTLEERLKEKGFDERKIRENLEAEALDVCLIEGLENHKEVYEIDTTKKTPEEIVEDIIKIMKGEKDEFKPGKIDWSEEFF
jgi:adenylate kinase